MVPAEWRRDPNAYNYYFKFSRGGRRAGLPARAAEQPEEAIECVICMNKIIWEVDAEGNVVDKDRQPVAEEENAAAGDLEMQPMPLAQTDATSDSQL